MSQYICGSRLGVLLFEVISDCCVYPARLTTIFSWHINLIGDLDIDDLIIDDSYFNELNYNTKFITFY